MRCHGHSFLVCDMRIKTDHAGDSQFSLGEHELAPFEKSRNILQGGVEAGGGTPQDPN